MQLDDIQLSLSWNGQSVQQCIKKTTAVTE